jgi:hypothetical protein
MKTEKELLEDHITVSLTKDIGQMVRTMAWDEHLSPGTLVRILIIEALRGRAAQKRGGK